MCYDRRFGNVYVKACVTKLKNFSHFPFIASFPNFFFFFGGGVWGGGGGGREGACLIVCLFYLFCLGLCILFVCSGFGFVLLLLPTAKKDSAKKEYPSEVTRQALSTDSPHDNDKLCRLTRFNVILQPT